MKSYFVFTILVFLPFITYGRRHVLSLKKDERDSVLCSHFGFMKGSYFSVSIEKLEGNFNYMTFTLDKYEVAGVVYYTNSGNNQCFRDKSFKVMYLSVDIAHNLLTVNRNSDQFNGLIFETGYLEFDFHSRNLSHVIENVLSSLHLGEDDSAKMTNEIVYAIQIDNSLSILASKIEKPYHVYQILYILASSNPSVFQNQSDSVLRMILPSGSLKGIPFIMNQGVLSSNFTIRFLNKSDEGLFSLYFHNCAKPNMMGKKPSVNLIIRMVERNPNSYLSAGQQPLPTLYMVMSFIYLVAGLIWLFYLRKSKNSVFRIHYLMFVVILIKSLSLTFHGVNYYVIGKHGVTEEGWAVMYYITHIVRGALLFITILLIGAGWAFIKHMLTPRERTVFIVVIPLQILANIATVVIEESEAGAARYALWKEIFIFVDLVCCAAILFPVVWSIKHLKTASQTDGKAAINLQNLRLFRHFYVLTICYVYFTRVIMYLMSITIFYSYSWLVELFKEAITFLFFVAVGYTFRPVSNNPYLLVSTGADEEEETLMERIQMEEVWSQSGALDNVTRLARSQPNSNSTGKSFVNHAFDSKMRNVENV